jgi:hypothetical protein
LSIRHLVNHRESASASEFVFGKMEHPFLIARAGALRFEWRQP